jgi:crossover junction endodeoxyribonuclease RuvC
VIVLGVDPGISGAVCWVHSSGALIAVADMPVVEVRGKNKISATGLRTLMRRRDCALVVIEQVMAMPRQNANGREIKMGAASTMSFGYGAGLIEGVATGLDLPVSILHPRSWKSRAGVPADKGAARQMAQRLWPASAAMFARVKDHGRADAALLARFVAIGERDTSPLPDFLDVRSAEQQAG